MLMSHACMRPTHLKQGKNIVRADGPRYCFSLLMLPAFCGGDGCYLCYAGGETTTLHLYFDLREAQRFRQEWPGSALYLRCVFGLGELGRISLRGGCSKAQDFAHAKICFCTFGTGRTGKEHLQGLGQGAAEVALLPALLMTNLSTCPAPGLESTCVVQQAGVSSQE